MNKMYLVLGDWSDDGHGKYDKILVESNKTVEEIQNAYKASCKLTGASFNYNEDYTERNRDSSEAGKYIIAARYEQGFDLAQEAKDVLKEHGLDYDSFLLEDDDSIYIFTKLWTEFVKLSLPDLVINEFAEIESIPVINGYWNKNLNVQFGYGLYH